MSVIKNYSYNVVNQIIAIIIPIITIPYVSRVLGAEGIGLNAYTNSIAQYFVLLGTFGISLYSTRIIAYNRDNKENLSLEFWSIFVFKLITVIFSLAGYIILMLCTNSENIRIYLIQSINIISAAVDITWFFIGMENFKKTVTRNIIIRIIGVILIFVFVKHVTDLWIYILINVTCTLIGQLSLWPYVPRMVKFVRIKKDDIIKHLMPSLKYFLPQIAIQVYVLLDKVMIGIFANNSAVGIYDNSDKIVNMALTLVTSVGAVMMPKITNMYASGELEKIKSYLKKSFQIECYIAIPIMLGLMGVAKEFSTWFFGNEFANAGIVIAMISPKVLAIAWSNVVAGQYLIPLGRINQYTICVVLGAVVNLILNLILIPHFTSIGASIATSISEFVVTGTEIYFIRNEINLKYFFEDVWKYVVSACVMFITVRLIGIYFGAGFRTTIIQVGFGVITYFVFLYLLKSDTNTFLFNKAKKIFIDSNKNIEYINNNKN